MKPQRPKQHLPVDIVESLLACIGELFYPDRAKTPAERKRWAQDRHWYRQRVITWAADWLNKRALTLKPERFKQLLLDKLTDLKRNTAQPIQNWPRYIVHCIQDHFRHNEDSIHAEAKATTVSIDHALDKARAAGASAQALDPIRVLAMAHQINKPRKKPVAKASNNQPTLFDL